MASKRDVALATNAFGMGVDEADIRFVEWVNPDLEYFTLVLETLRGWGERIRAKDLEDLRDELLVSSRGDQRVQVCLDRLRVLGVTAGSFESRDLRVVRTLEPGELPDFGGSEEKRRSDLASLLAIVRDATKGEECRRVGLARQFGPAEPEEACGSCDRCVDPERARRPSSGRLKKRLRTSGRRREGSLIFGRKGPRAPVAES